MSTIVVEFFYQYRMIHCVKSFFKSMKTLNVYFFLSRDALISFTKSSSPCKVDIEERNPYWLFDKTLFLSINCSSFIIVFQVVWRTDTTKILDCSY